MNKKEKEKEKKRKKKKKRKEKKIVGKKKQKKKKSQPIVFSDFLLTFFSYRKFKSNFLRSKPTREEGQRTRIAANSIDSRGRSQRSCETNALHLSVFLWKNQRKHIEIE